MKKPTSFYQPTKSKLVVSLLVLFCCQIVTVSAQRILVENVAFSPLENSQVEIKYDLISQNASRPVVVNVFLRQQSNPTLNYKLKALYGAAGKGNFHGKENTIIWDMNAESSQKFTPDPFVDDYFFVIDARRKGGGGAFLLLIIAGGVYLLLSGSA